MYIVFFEKYDVIITPVSTIFNIVRCFVIRKLYKKYVISYNIKVVCDL